MTRQFIIIIISLFIWSCGGGSDSETSTSNDSVSNIDNLGGTASNPTAVSFSKKNIVSSSSFDNYFTLSLGEKALVYISVMLEGGMETIDKTRCRSNIVAADGFIKVNGTGIACDHRATIELEAGNYELHFDFPSQNSGYFNIDKVMNGTETVLPANGSGGLPSAPREILIDGQNSINKDLLQNFYVYTGVAGNRIVINTYLDETVPEIMFTRCRSNAGNVSTGSAIGISINNSTYNCDSDLDYVLPEDGTYIFHLFYMAPSDITYPVAGYFRIDIQN
jgi:hypothetical protein